MFGCGCESGVGGVEGRVFHLVESFELLFALEPFSKIISKLLRFGVERGSVFVECGCGWGLFRGVCGVGRLGQRNSEDWVICEVVA